MKICFFSPYFPKHFGGGEKHLLDVALAAAKNHTVSIAISHTTHSEKSLQQITKQYEEFYGSALDQIKFIFTPLGTNSFFIKKLWWTSNFDALYYVTDGSLFFSLAKHNYLHIQIPFTHALNWVDRLKLVNWNSINTNSNFTKRIVEKFWKITVNLVIHPLVNTSIFKAKKKEKIILHVGRFFTHLHSKRQDVLVEIYKKLVDQNARLMHDWKLILVGSVEDEKYFKQVERAAQGYRVDIITDASREKLISLYEKSTIYWHATGYEIDEESTPERVEHFGITTIEAMAAAVVPLVVGKGGQREVLGDLYYELNWNSQDECIQKTVQLISDKNKLEDLRSRVTKQAEKFSQNEFNKKVFALFSI